MLVRLQVLVFLRESDNPGALIARGDAYYFLGRFEHALVRYCTKLYKNCEAQSLEEDRIGLVTQR